MSETRQEKLTCRLRDEKIERLRDAVVELNAKVDSLERYRESDNMKWGEDMRQMESVVDHADTAMTKAETRYFEHVTSLRENVTMVRSELRELEYKVGTHMGDIETLCVNCRAVPVQKSIKKDRGNIEAFCKRLKDNRKIKEVVLEDIDTPKNKVDLGLYGNRSFDNDGTSLCF